MNASLETVSNRSGICFGVSASGTCILIFQAADGSNALCISKRKGEQSESGLHHALTIESESKKDSFGPLAALDSQEKYIFASLADRKGLYIFSVPEQSCRLKAFESVHALRFEGELFSLKSFRNRMTSDYSDVVAAISVSGEVALLCAFGDRPSTTQRKLEVPAVDRVVSVATYGDGHLVIVALRKSQLLFYTVRISEGKTLESLKIEILPELFLPQAPRNAPSLLVRDGIIGFGIEKECAVVLYPGGYVHILAPATSLLPSTDTSFTTCWYSSKSGNSETPRETSSPVLRHAMRLSQGPALGNDLTAPIDWRGYPHEVSGVVTLGSGFFAVAYGEYVSIWDGIYSTGHAYVQAPMRVDFLFRDSSTGHAFSVSKNTVQRLRFGDKRGSVSLTLGAAIKRKGACDSIVISLQQNAERAPLRSQPVIVGPTQAAAESGGQIDRIFRRLMDTEEEREVKQIRALLSRDAIPSPEAVIATTHTYFKHKRRVRRGDHGNEMDLGLAKLPSERLAAVSVARCLFEISCGNSTFVVPLIDMVGTGVVSSEAVVSVLSVSDSWDMGPETKSLGLLSICDPLIASSVYLNAIEAVLSRIADLPERDVVRLFQFAVQLTVATRSARGTEPLERWQCKRLLTRCMVHPVQRNRLIQVIKKLPFSDVISCIGVLEEFLSDEAEPPQTGKPDVPRHVRMGLFKNNRISREEALMYRGLGNWVDKDYERRLGSCAEDEAEACVRWISYLIDAHLATLIIDENGQQVASRMLHLIQTRRKEAEALKGMSGLVSHLIEQDAVPGSQDPLYKVMQYEVPLPMALE